MWRTHRGQKPAWWHRFSLPALEPPLQMHINSGRFPSTRIYEGRMNKQVCDHGGWTTRSIAVSTSTTQNRLTYSPRTGKSQTSSSKIIGKSCKRFAQPSSVAKASSRLWSKRSQHGGTHPRTSDSPSSMPKQHWSRHTQHLHGSLGHAGKHVSANHSHAVPDGSAANVGSITYQNGTPHENIRTQNTVRRKKKSVEERSSSQLGDNSELGVTHPRDLTQKIILSFCIDHVVTWICSPKQTKEWWIL